MEDQKSASNGDPKAVTPSSGKAYCNWIPLVKQKLKTRDRRLIQFKLQQIETIVNDNLQSPQYTIPQNITRQIFEDLFRIIDAWNGVREKSILPKKYTFKQYFSIAKKYYDSKKLIALGFILWVPIFKHIAQILPTHNPSNFDGVIYALFMSKIEYDKTKKHSLINATTAVRSKELQSYLLNLFPSLKIREWVGNATVNHSSSVAATVFEQICYKLYHILHDQSEPSTDCTVSMGNGMNGLYSQNPQMYGGSIVTVPSQSQPSMCDCVCVCNNSILYTAQNPLTFNPQMYNTVANTFHSQASTVRMANNRNNQFQSQNLWTNTVNNNAFYSQNPLSLNPQKYDGSHSMTNTVTDARYSPLLSAFAPVTHFQKEFVCNCSLSETPKIWNGFNSWSRGPIPQRMNFNNSQTSNVNEMKPIRNILNGFVQAPNYGNAFAEPISNSDETESIAAMFPWDTQSIAPIIPLFTQSMDSMFPFGNDLCFEN